VQEPVQGASDLAPRPSMASPDNKSWHLHRVVGERGWPEPAGAAASSSHVVSHCYSWPRSPWPSAQCPIMVCRRTRPYRTPPDYPRSWTCFAAAPTRRALGSLPHAGKSWTWAARSTPDLDADAARARSATRSSRRSSSDCSRRSRR